MMRNPSAAVFAVLELSSKAVEELRAAMVAAGCGGCVSEYEGEECLDLNGFLVRVRRPSAGHARVERRGAKGMPPIPRRPVRGGRTK